MVKCWASTLGDCDKQSGEHYLSECLWDSNKIIVKGFWGQEEKEISYGSLNANILCRKHNSELSELDSGIRKISDTIAEFYRLYVVRAKLGRRNLLNVLELRINGNILERWAAKFFVGLFYAVGKDSLWHETKTNSLQPPEQLVKAIYGLEPFNEPMGLYLAYEVGEQHHHEREVIRAETLMHPDGGLVGGNFDFNGFRFISWLSPEPIHSSFVKSTAGTVFGPGAAELTYRPKVNRFMIKRVLVQRLVFEWD